LNTKLWNSGIESDKDLARDQKRKLHFMSNILVVKDPSNPENEGKVFLYKYGKKIFDKLNDLMNPAFDDEEPVNPFDFWEGANFRLKIRQVDGYRNYDKSDFDTSSSVSDDDSELENIWNLQYSLQAFVDPKNFKSYEELQNKLDRVLGNESVVVKPKKVVQELEEESPPEMKSVSTDSDDDLDELFKSLSEE
jgi:hypothetical protein